MIDHKHVRALCLTLAYMRVAAGATRKQLAAGVGVTGATIERLENGAPGRVDVLTLLNALSWLADRLAEHPPPKLRPGPQKSGPKLATASYMSLQETGAWHGAYVQVPKPSGGTSNKLFSVGRFGSMRAAKLAAGKWRDAEVRRLWGKRAPRK